MRFLIVDDADAPLLYLQRELARLGHEVVGVARNGVDAVAACRELRPDVVILDVIMPRMNGLDALQAIHSLQPSTSVIMSSSLQSCQTALEAERRGALYCLAKPFDPARLRTAIDRIAAGAGRNAASTARPAVAESRA